MEKYNIWLKNWKKGHSFDDDFFPSWKYQQKYIRIFTEEEFGPAFNWKEIWRDWNSLYPEDCSWRTQKRMLRRVIEKQLT